MSIWAVVDNAPAAWLLKRLLGPLGLEVANAGERSTAMMMAAGAAGTREEPVALVLDSDSLEERSIVEDQLEIGGYLRRSSGATPSKLVLAVPQVEAVLFSDRAGLERALGRKIADDDAFEARFRPKAVFRRLLGDGPTEERALEVIDRLDDAALSRMAKHPVIREIADFAAKVRGHQEPVHAEPVRRSG
jgi:hypothetical protein